MVGTATGSSGRPVRARSPRFPESPSKFTRDIKFERKSSEFDRRSAGGLEDEFQPRGGRGGPRARMAAPASLRHGLAKSCGRSGQPFAAFLNLLRTEASPSSATNRRRGDNRRLKAAPFFGGLPAALSLVIVDDQ